MVTLLSSSAVPEGGVSGEDWRLTEEGESFGYESGEDKFTQAMWLAADEITLNSFTCRIGGTSQSRRMEADRLTFEKLSKGTLLVTKSRIDIFEQI
jgi:hypothetical protein